MSVGGSEPRKAGVTDDELMELLLADRSARLGEGATITRMRRIPFDRAASYPAEEILVHLTNGRCVKLLLKDLSSSQLPKDGPRERREREFRVYRDLLRRVDAGTAVFCGAIRDDSLDRLCLLLEFVDGIALSSVGFDHWLVAAGWLGRLHAQFAGHEDYLEGCEFLLRHDALFFRSKAERAQEAVGEVSPPLGRRLTRALRYYHERVTVMANEPRTLVHGSYRPENILINLQTSPARVCPVDRELAGYGSPLYGLAFLADGSRPPKLGALWNAYEEEASRNGLTVPSQDHAWYLLDCFYLHKIIKTLSGSRTWNFTERTVAKLVTKVEQRSACQR